MSSGERPARRVTPAAAAAARRGIRAASLVWLVSVGGDLAVMATWLPYASTDGNALSFVVLAPVMIAYASLGWLLLRQRPGHRIGWLLLTASLMIIWFAGGFYLSVQLADDRGPGSPLAAAAFTLAMVSLVPMFVVEIGLLPILYPDGRLPGPRWRWPVRTALLGALASSACFILAPKADPTAPFDNPFSPPGAPAALADLAGVLGVLAVVLICLLAVASVVVRFRRGRGDERQQLKWMLAPVVLALGLNVPSFVGVSSDLLGVAGAAALLLVPVAITMAILRYRLYDIDRLISRTIAYALVTALLVATFVIGNLALQALLEGVTQGSTLAVAGSTLLVFAAAQPAWRRIRRIVDRRFDRARVDAARVAAAFSDRQRDRVDLQAVVDDLRSTTDQVLRPAAVGVWLRADRGSAVRRPRTQ